MNLKWLKFTTIVSILIIQLIMLTIFISFSSKTGELLQTVDTNLLPTIEHLYSSKSALNSASEMFKDDLQLDIVEAYEVTQSLDSVSRHLRMLKSYTKADDAKISKLVDTVTAEIRHIEHTRKLKRDNPAVVAVNTQGHECFKQLDKIIFVIRYLESEELIMDKVTNDFGRAQQAYHSFLKLRDYNADSIMKQLDVAHNHLEKLIDYLPELKKSMSEIQRLRAVLGSLYNSLNQDHTISFIQKDLDETHLRFKSLKKTLYDFSYWELKKSKENIGHSLFAMSSTQDKVTVMGIAMVAIGSMVVFAAGRFIDRQLNKLAYGSERLGKGELQTRIEIQTHDSFGTLAQSFNNMALSLENKNLILGNTLSDLDRARKELESTNELLEDRVKARTRALEDAIETQKSEIRMREAAERKLKLASEVIKHTTEAVLITNNRNEIIDVNDAYVKTTKYERSEVIGRDPGFAKSRTHGKNFYDMMWSGIRNEGHWQGEVLNQNKFGSPLPILLSISVIRDSNGNVANHIAVFSDISEIKETQRKLTDLAYSDTLTRLGNRHQFRLNLREAIRIDQNSDSQTVLLFIDLDKFKNINDSLGHDQGDLLLIEIAHRIESCMRRSTDSVARLGGDEFTVIMQGCSDLEVVKQTVDELIQTIGQEMELAGQSVSIGASIGIACHPADGSNYETLTKRADLAMYRAKEAGRNCYKFFSHDMELHFDSRMQLETDLRHAIENDEFDVYYQPQLDMRTNEVIGAEALVRWNRGGNEIIMPDQFIDMAEETGLIIPIGEIVLRKVCEQIRQWTNQLPEVPAIAINFSTLQFLDADLVHMISETMKRYAIQPKQLHIELTESAAMEDVEHAKVVFSELQELGLKIHLDDFGTGYCSLGYLKDFPIARIKIDKSFVSGCYMDPEDSAIIQTIISLAKDIHADVLAEGVERQEHIDFLLNKGCSLCQGYFYSKPLPANEFESYFEEQHSQARIAVAENSYLHTYNI